MTTSSPRQSPPATTSAKPTKKKPASSSRPTPTSSSSPPTRPQLLIKLGQVRQVIHVAYYRPPVESKRSFSIFTSSAFMKEAANSLLKVLEEPPDHTSLILLTENPQELLPTIRSRAVVHRLGAIPSADLESLLAQRRPELNPKDRALAARLAEGAVGRALTIDLAVYLASRQDALILLRTALREPGAPRIGLRPRIGTRLFPALPRHRNLPRRRRRPGENHQPPPRPRQPH